MMKKIFSFFIVLLMCRNFVFSQIKHQAQIDSLTSELAKAKEDTAKLNLLTSIMYAHVYYNPQEGLNYQQAALELAQKTKWPIGTAKVKDKIGRLNWRLGNFAEALKNHFEALDIYTKADDKYKNYVLVEIGQDYLDDGKYTDAETWLLKALKLSTAVGDKKTMSNAYDVIIYLYNTQGNTAEMTKMIYAYLKLSEEMGDKKGMMHVAYTSAVYFQSLGNDTTSLKYFKQALQVAKESGDRIAIANFDVYIGGHNLKMGNISEAQHYYFDALRLANENGDAQLLGEIHMGIGDFYQEQKKYTEAIRNYVIAEGEFESVKDKQNIAIVNYKMGSTYTSTKQYGLARKSFDKSHNLYEKLNTQLLSMGDYYSGMEMLDKATGNWKDAYQHYKEFIDIRDSAFNKETLKKIVSSQLQYENDKKEAVEKAEQEKKDIKAQNEINRQRNIRNSSFAVLALVLIFSIVIYRQRNKIAGEKKRSDQLLADKELLLKEIHHRVKNNLEVVSSLLALQSAQIDDPHTREAMQAGQNRVHSIGIVHQKLYQGTNLGAIEMKDYFINLSESILDSFGAEKRVTIECAMDQLDVDIDTAVPLGLIVNELLTNTLKYAFPEGQQGKVRIKLQKQTDGALHLEVSDNGVGKSGITYGTGFGGQLVSLLTQQLSGSMREEIKNGTSIYFEFKPIKAA